MEKQRGMAFDFRKTATTVKNTGYLDRYHGISALVLHICDRRIYRTINTHECPFVFSDAVSNTVQQICALQRYVSQILRNQY
jgi:hypothetical protein